MKCVDAARLSPSAMNRQPLKYVIVNDEKLLSEVFNTTSWAGYLPDYGPTEEEMPRAYIVVLLDREIRKNHDKSSSRPGHMPSVPLQNNARMAAATRPMVRPFSEKARPGSQGNRSGVNIAPAASAVKTAMAAKRPWWTVLVQNSPGPKI